jgi:hypothetical protein
MKAPPHNIYGKGFNRKTSTRSNPQSAEQVMSLAQLEPTTLGKAPVAGIDVSYLDSVNFGMI